MFIKRQAGRKVAKRTIKPTVMDSAPDEGPQVFIQLRPQISTENLSDAEFDSKTTAAAARISSRLKPCNISTLAARLSVIAEDEYVGRRYHDTKSMKEIPTTTSSPDEDDFPLAHPGNIVPLSPHAQAEVDNFSSDITERAGGEVEGVAQETSVNVNTLSIVNADTEPMVRLARQFTLTHADGSSRDVAAFVTTQPDGQIKDVTEELGIIKTDGLYEYLISEPGRQPEGHNTPEQLISGSAGVDQPEPDNSAQTTISCSGVEPSGQADTLQDLHDIAPWPSATASDSQLPESQDQATSTIAPFLFQDDGHAEPFTPTYHTPPSNLSRVNRTNRSSRVVPLTGKHASEDLEDLEFRSDPRRRSLIPLPLSLTPITPRTSSLAHRSDFTPSPRSATSLLSTTSKLRSISSKIPFPNLRKHSSKIGLRKQISKFDSSSSSEYSTHSATQSTIGGTPYEDHVSGPAPSTRRAIHNRPIQDVNNLRPLSLASQAHHPFEGRAAMERIMETPEDQVNDVAVANLSADRNASTETITPTPRVSRRGQASPLASHQHPATAVSYAARAEFHADAATLFNAPAPLLSDHPMNRPSEDAFEIMTSYPLMSTSTPAPLIKAMAKDMHELALRSGGFGDVRKKKSYRNLGGLLAKPTPPAQMGYGAELPPIIATRNVALAQSSDGSVPPTPSSIAATVDSREKRGNRLRKISTIFTKGNKTSDSSMALPADSQNPLSAIIVRDFQPIVEDQPRLSGWDIMDVFKRKQDATSEEAGCTPEELKYLDNHIRNHLAYHKKDYKPGAWPLYPSHPNNPARAWDHANLRCSECLPGFCACCGKVCCAHQAMTMRLSLFSKESEEENGLKEMLAEVIPDEKVRPNPKNLTKELKDALGALFPCVDGEVLEGETATFLMCTGCEKMVCPGCCGMCPEKGCTAMLCRKCCNGDLWAPCKGH